MVRNMVRKLQVRCQHNPDHVVLLDGLQKHEHEDCRDLPRACLLCNASVPQQNLTAHLEATHSWAEVAQKQMAMQELAAAGQEAAMAELRESMMQQQQAAIAQQEAAITELQGSMMQQQQAIQLLLEEKLGTEPRSFRAAGFTVHRCRQAGYSAKGPKNAFGGLDIDDEEDEEEEAEETSPSPNPNPNCKCKSNPNPNPDSSHHHDLLYTYHTNVKSG